MMEFIYLDKTYKALDIKTEIALIIYFDIFYPILKMKHNSPSHHPMIKHYLKLSHQKNLFEVRALLRDEVDWVTPHLRKVYPTIIFMEI